MKQLCLGEVPCVVTGALGRALKLWKGHSAFVMLLALTRPQSLQVTARVSDVLRGVCEIVARFHVIDVDEVSNGDSDSESSNDSDIDSLLHFFLKT
jgi:hypothetical protein